jgi:zinc protease
MRYFTLLLFCVFSFCAYSENLTLTNGVRIITKRLAISPIASIEILIDYSTMDESAMQSGLREAVMVTMLKNLSNESDISNIGGNINIELKEDCLEFAAKVPATQIDSAILLLNKIITKPDLNDNIIIQVLKELSSRKFQMPDDSMGIAYRMSEKEIFANHPYFPVSENKLKFDRLNPDIVRLAYQQYIIPKNCIIAIAGDIDVATAGKTITKLFSDWTGGNKIQREIRTVPALSESDVKLVEMPVNSTAVMMAFPGPGLKHPDSLTMQVINHLLSSGTGGRIFKSIREQQRLAYDAATLYSPYAEGAIFTAYTITDRSLMESVKNALVKELGLLQTKEATQTELNRAKEMLIGEYTISHQSSSQFAFDLAWNKLCEKPDNYDEKLPELIRKITPADVMKVSRRWFTRYSLSIVLPQIQADN